MTRVLFRTDAGPRIGWGHLVRCMVLAEALKADGIESVFLLESSDGPAWRKIAEEFRVVRLKGPLSHPSNVPSVTLGDWVVVDHPTEEGSADLLLRDRGFRVLRIDDYGRRGLRPHLLLNQNPHAGRDMYRDARNAKLLLGLKYALLRKPFRRAYQRTFRERANRVLVCFGGSDPMGLTEQVGADLPEGVRARFVIGPSAQVRVGGEIFRSVSAAEMRRLMLWADVGVFAVGTICWEAARLGLPSLIVPTSVQQQALFVRSVRTGSMLPLREPFASCIRNLLMDARARRKMQKIARGLVDGQGVARVLAAMRALKQARS